MKIYFTCDQMSEDQIAVPTFLPRTAIVGVRNVYNFPDGLLELQDTFKRNLLLPQADRDPEALLVARPAWFTGSKNKEKTERNLYSNLCM